MRVARPESAERRWLGNPSCTHQVVAAVTAVRAAVGLGAGVQAAVAHQVRADARREVAVLALVRLLAAVDLLMPAIMAEEHSN